MIENNSQHEMLKNEIDNLRRALPMYDNIPEGELVTVIITNNIAVANRILKSGTNYDINRYIEHLKYINTKAV